MSTFALGKRSHMTSRENGTSCHVQIFARCSEAIGGLTAEEVFTDHHGEWDAFFHSLLAQHAAILDTGFSIEDVEAPRRNVLAFYGVGGIGKSSLSSRLQDHIISYGTAVPQWSRLPDGLPKLLPVRIDLSRKAGVDFESLVLALRLAVGQLDHGMPAFDLALRRYWDANHPGDSLEEHLKRSKFLRRFSSALALPEQTRSALADAVSALSLPGTFGSFAGQALRAVVVALRDQRLRSKTLARCVKLADLLEAAPDLDALSYYAHLLAWDLAGSSRQVRFARRPA